MLQNKTIIQDFHTGEKIMKKTIKIKELIIIKPKPINNYDKLMLKEEIIKNDRFSKSLYEGLCVFEVTKIVPILPEDEKKYIYKNKIKIYETYKDYKAHLFKMKSQDLTWVYNIFNKTQDSEEIYYENDDIVLMPDLKWDKKSIKNLYCLAIFKNKIYTIRDLNSSHLKLLKRVKNTVTKIIKKKFGINENYLRMYFHYPPSFWHLHLHINLIKNNHNGISTDVAWTLDNVIQNIELVNDYFQKINMAVIRKMI